MMPATNIRINLWSSPRNVSTALMYSFAQRADTAVVDEPLYAYYLKTTGIDHPAKKEILASIDDNLKRLINNILLKEYTTPIVFFKQMTHHLCERNYDFLNDFTNIIFIRDPRLIIRSYAKVRQEVTIQDIGIEQQMELLNFLKDPIVLDSKILLQQPKAYLQALCNALAIPFTESMLQWQAGPKKEDGIWAKYWYQNVHQSTGFSPYQKTDFELPEPLASLAKQCMPYYEELSKRALKV